jgi:hypothetical protein
LSVGGNVAVANANAVHFGGQQGNTVANSLFKMAYNAASISLDITYIGP